MASRNYTKEQKEQLLEAAKQYKNTQEASKALGVSDSALYRWGHEQAAREEENPANYSKDQKEKHKHYALQVYQYASYAEAAKKLGVSDKSLKRWCEKYAKYGPNRVLINPPTLVEPCTTGREKEETIVAMLKDHVLDRLICNANRITSRELAAIKDKYAEELNG